jgi:hypothetical protein
LPISLYLGYPVPLTLTRAHSPFWLVWLCAAVLHARAQRPVRNCVAPRPELRSPPSTCRKGEGTGQPKYNVIGRTVTTSHHPSRRGRAERFQLSGGPGGKREREKVRDRQRYRERERFPARLRSRSQERKRQREKERKREREKERTRERERETKRKREREKERTRENEKERKLLVAPTAAKTGWGVARGAHQQWPTF